MYTCMFGPMECSGGVSGGLFKHNKMSDGVLALCLFIYPSLSAYLYIMKCNTHKHYGYSIKIIVVINIIIVYL